MDACTFIGHKDTPWEVKGKVSSQIETLITKFGVDTFYVGSHGNFDRIVYDSLCQLEKKYEIKVCVVLSYLNRKPEWYDLSKTVFPARLDNVPPRYAINKRNQFMIEQSKYMICYVDNTQTNAYAFAEMANKKGLLVFNLGQVKF